MRWILSVVFLKIIRYIGAKKLRDSTLWAAPARELCEESKRPNSLRRETELW